MCGKVISGADYEQINSFGGGGFFKRTANFSSRTESPEHKKGRGTNAAAEAVSPPGRISGRHPYEPQLGRTAAPEIAPQSGRHSRRRNVRPQPPYPNKRFSSAANLYPAFSTCASANSCEKMMKSRDSSYESV